MALLKPDEHERMMNALRVLRESGHVVTARNVADAGASCVGTLHVGIKFGDDHMSPQRRQQ